MRPKSVAFIHVAPDLDKLRDHVNTATNLLASYNAVKILSS